MPSYKFKDTSVSEYVINANSEEEAIKILDKLWWTKTKSIHGMIEKQEIKVKDKVWIEYENN
tara:strand:- start:102 stop:287 length:186 start_codon:yes stop_codon:yes gene_type:complete